MCPVYTQPLKSEDNMFYIIVGLGILCLMLTYLCIIFFSDMRFYESLFLEMEKDFDEYVELTKQLENLYKDEVKILESMIYKG